MSPPPFSSFDSPPSYSSPLALFDLSKSFDDFLHLMPPSVTGYSLPTHPFYLTPEKDKAAAQQQLSNLSNKSQKKTKKRKDNKKIKKQPSARNKPKNKKRSRAFQKNGNKSLLTKKHSKPAPTTLTNNALGKSHGKAGVESQGKSDVESQGTSGVESQGKSGVESQGKRSKIFTRKRSTGDAEDGDDNTLDSAPSRALNRALSRARGEKPAEMNLLKIRKTQKRKITKKRKSQKEWKQRIEAVNTAQKEKQRTRRENIKRFRTKAGKKEQSAEHERLRQMGETNRGRETRQVGGRGGKKPRGGRNKEWNKDQKFNQKSGNLIRGKKGGRKTERTNTHPRKQRRGG